MSENKDTKINEIEKSLEIVARGLPSHKEIINAFRELFIARAVLKSELRVGPLPGSFSIDPERFAQGETVFMANGYPEMAHSQWEITVERIFPALATGFPHITDALSCIKEVVLADQFNPDGLVESVLCFDEQAISEKFAGIEVPFSLMAFVLGQCAKPFIEKQAEAVKPYCEKLNWQKGYCPICGSYPELSILKGQYGERWLRCSCCTNEWRYIRAACPVCENNKPDQAELIFLEDRPYERAELCYNCHKHVLGVDMRKTDGKIMLDVLPLSLLHLDMLAREKGSQSMGINLLNSIN